MRKTQVFVTFLAAGTCFAQAPSINSVNGVVNGGSFLPGITANSWITIRGTSLSTTTRLWTTADFQGTRLPLALDGVSVRINNRDAPVYYISPTQINALAPADTAIGNVPVTVTNARGTSAAVQASMQRLSPGWFAFEQQGGVYPAAAHPDGIYVGPTTLFGSAVTAVPAAPGGRVLLFGTGFGTTTPAVDPLVRFDGAAPLATPNDLRILVGGVSAVIEFAGMTGNGMFQFNIVVPNLADGEHALIAEIGGLRSQSLRLAVRRPPPVPQITTMSPADFVWGQETSVSLTGTNLTGATRVEFSDPSQLRVVGTPSTSATSVNFTLGIDADAVPGERTIAVVGPGGRSNTRPFQVRRGEPKITSVTPAVVYPGRVYSSSFIYSSTRAEFLINGEDLAGVKTTEIAPEDGVRYVPSTPVMTSLGGWLIVDANAGTGTRRVRATSPAGSTNDITFEVQPAPAAAPVIADVTLQTPTTGNGTVTWRGRLTFTDSDGDIRSGTGGAILRFTALGGVQGSPVQNFDATGSFLDKAGQTSGTIDLVHTKNVFLILRFTAPIEVGVTLIDAGDRPSNTVRIMVPTWIAPVL